MDRLATGRLTDSLASVPWTGPSPAHSCPFHLAALCPLARPLAQDFRRPLSHWSRCPGHWLSRLTKFVRAHLDGVDVMGAVLRVD